MTGLWLLQECVRTWGQPLDLDSLLTADATGLPAVAGPAEATALGNVLVQARALGAAPATLPGLRAILRSCLALRTFAPAGNARGWESAAARLV